MLTTRLRRGQTPGRLVAQRGRLSTAVRGPSWTGEDLRRGDRGRTMPPSPRQEGTAACGDPGLPTPGLVFSPPMSGPQIQV